MEHVVFFPAPDGAPAFRRVASLEQAVRLVEHLRNDEGVSSVSVHSLAEVPLAFRAYYKVELPAEAHVPAQQAADPVLEPAAEPLAEPFAEPLAELEPVVEPEPRHEAPALALVEDVPAEEPVLVSSGPSPQSLGFFA